MSDDDDAPDDGDEAAAELTLESANDYLGAAVAIYQAATERIGIIGEAILQPALAVLTPASGNEAGPTPQAAEAAVQTVQAGVDLIRRTVRGEARYRRYLFSLALAQECEGEDDTPEAQA